MWDPDSEPVLSVPKMAFVPTKNRLLRTCFKIFFQTFPCYFLKKFSIFIKSAEFTSAGILLGNKNNYVPKYIHIYIYITQTKYIYVKYIKNLFLNTHGKGVCVWWIVFKLYMLVHVN